MAKKTKLVKLHGKYRPTTQAWLNNNSGKEVPWLNVSGIWLEAAGFNVGDRIEIAVENKMLTIKNIATDGATGD